MTLKQVEAELVTAWVGDRSVVLKEQSFPTIFIPEFHIRISKACVFVKTYSPYAYILYIFILTETAECTGG